MESFWALIIIRIIIIMMIIIWKMLLILNHKSKYYQRIFWQFIKKIIKELIQFCKFFESLIKLV